MGGLYRRKKKMPDGALVPVGPWWIRWSRGGKEYRETSRTLVEREAKQLLHLRQGDVARGIRIDPRQYRITVGELLDALINNYKMHGKKSLPYIKIYIDTQLRPRWGHWRAASLMTMDIDKWIVEKQNEGYKPATINTWTAALRRALALGVECGNLMWRPRVSKLRTQNARQGYFKDRSQYEDFRRFLPSYMHTLCDVAYITGWRKTELLTRQWRHVDLESGKMMLESGETKNGHARTFPFNTELRALLQAQWEATKALQQTQGMVIPWVFHNEGHQIINYDVAWRQARLKAGQPARLFHDFRRTAYRNMIRNGVDASTAQRLVGWLGHEMPARYNIISETDLRNGVQKIDREIVAVQ